ncbi:AIR carboxylase [Oxobacter pfennigii]|uniref:AIR carboxylase n=1 Tax=Oxobacter pfennigii TaxID=36849 RepID=A0A0P8WDC6_9CLOT|nr:nickel pincer cofactor biosynthesis protein LarB [Oxobacter pfennigii]KPU45900.1 AIR carboxylase [Oxobacter pfennigii]
METDSLKALLENVRSGNVSTEEALLKLKKMPFEDIGFAKVDNHRALRVGYPEVIYCEGKNLEHIKKIVGVMLKGDSNILATRASVEVYNAIKEVDDSVIYNELARICFIKKREIGKTEGKILVVTGGTSDIAVAEEAAITSEVLGNTVERLYDVGVAGIHRLLSNTDVLFNARVLIVVAGMEGALASVVAGLVDKPVIAVPTSIGYGANFKGLSALLTMLNSCASGIGVMNIDNGFGAGYLASMINKLGESRV